MRVAVIGMGLRMAGMLELLQQVNPQARLAGVADPDQARVKER